MPKDSSEKGSIKTVKTKSKLTGNKFKIAKTKHPISPSVSEISLNLKKSPEISFKINSIKKKKRKRINSENSINKSATKVKKKKKNTVKKYSRLVFEESTNGSLNGDNLYDAPTSEEHNDPRDSLDCSYISDDSDIDILDTKIEGLKLQDIFQPATNRCLSSSRSLNIPKEHFKICENDLEPDFKMYENEKLSGKKKYIKKNGNNTAEASSSSEFNETETQIYAEPQTLVENIQNDTENIQNDTENGGFEYENLTSQAPTDFIINITLKNNDILLIINTFEKIYIWGLCAVEILQGQLEIMGSTLSTTSGVKKVYSPRGSALLYLQNNTRAEQTSFRDIKHFISEDLLYEEDKTISLNEAAGVVLCKNLDEPFISFIEKHTPQVLFPTVDNDGPRVVFGPPGAWTYVQTDFNWAEMTENISKSSKIAICGGKGVGKSTFLRYCINRLLQKFEKVRVVDLDPGQTEFTVPGCISSVKVSEELFGSNYTHHIPFDRAILCNINVGYDINQYLKSAQTLVEFLKDQEDIPTLYNLCGYHKGLGLDMTMKILNLVKPTRLIQIKSSNRNKNYIFDLTAENLRKNLSKCDLGLNYEFFELKSGADGPKAKCWTMEARSVREVNILAYLGKLMSETVTDLTSDQINLYSINLSSLKIKDSENNNISPLAINANLVALCSVLEEHSQFLCHGWGFVRGLDIENDILVIITPETLDTMNQVDHLVLTTNSVVPSLLMTTGEVQGHVPYIAKGHLSNFAQFTKRSHLPPKSNW